MLAERFELVARIRLEPFKAPVVTLVLGPAGADELEEGEVVGPVPTTVTVRKGFKNCQNIASTPFVCNQANE
jgi:hypothetical protein